MKNSVRIEGYSFIVEDVLKTDKAAWVKSIAKSHWPDLKVGERAVKAVAAYDAIVKFDADSKAEETKTTVQDNTVKEQKAKDDKELDAAVIAALGGNTKAPKGAGTVSESTPGK